MIECCVALGLGIGLSVGFDFVVWGGLNLWCLSWFVLLLFGLLFWLFGCWFRVIFVGVVICCVLCCICVGFACLMWLFV